MSSALDSAASNLQQVALMSDGSKTKAERDLVRTLANIHCLHAEVWYGLIMVILYAKDVFSAHTLALHVGPDIHAAARWFEAWCATKAS